MYYIYCYTNLINGKKYVGQTCNIQRRCYQHRHSAYHPNDKDYNALFHCKIREYGITNFSFQILEEIDTVDLSYVDEREIFWIEKLNTYVRNGQGYNLTYGGQGKIKSYNRILSEDDIKEIFRLLIDTDIPQNQIAEQFNVSKTTINKMNTGRLHIQKDIEYPIRKHKISQDIIDQIKKLLAMDISQQKIANTVGVSLSTVKRVKSTLKTS